MQRFLGSLSVAGMLAVMVAGQAALGQMAESSAIESVLPPKGSSISYKREGDVQRWEYTAPSNFEDPIKIFFEPIDAESENKKADVLVWADVIHWNDATQSATASGRIIVDDRKEYRIETTYVKYDQDLLQIFCPRRVKIIQRAPGKPDNLMVATSALVTLSEDGGIKSMRFDELIEMRYVFNKKTSPFKNKSKKSGGGAKNNASSSSGGNAKSVPAKPAPKRSISPPAD
jgi:hypothetical protein